MIVLDVGNSSVKWAIDKNGLLEGGGRFYYRDEGFSRSASRALEGLPAPRVLAVATVAGAGMEHEISEWAGKILDTAPCYIRATKQAAGVTNAYQEPGTLGADRWAAIVAAHHDTDNPVCVIDCGTAITLDVVDAAGRHLGGLIAPGLAMMRRSLVQETAAIGPMPDGADGLQSLFSRNTIEGVNSGVMHMAGALIDRVTGEAAAGHGRTLEAVITGGDAEKLLPLLLRTPRYDRHLVLKGIALLAREMLCGT
ncbi:MAG: type III pantothenate kinase [Gammaproteobacteria bacterium]